MVKMYNGDTVGAQADSLSHFVAVPLAARGRVFGLWLFARTSPSHRAYTVFPPIPPYGGHCFPAQPLVMHRMRNVPRARSWRDGQPWQSTTSGSTRTPKTRIMPRITSLPLCLTSFALRSHRRFSFLRRCKVSCSLERVLCVSSLIVFLWQPIHLCLAKF